MKIVKPKKMTRTILRFLLFNSDLIVIFCLNYTLLERGFQERCSGSRLASKELTVVASKFSLILVSDLFIDSPESFFESRLEFIL